MTNFDLLSYIGNVDDQYIMDSRKKPRKKNIWPQLAPAVIAAVLLLTVMTTGVKYVLSHGFGSSAAGAPAESTAAGAPAEEGAPEAEAAVPEEAPAETVEEAPAEEAPNNVDEGLWCLANAVYPDSIAYDDTEASGLVWKENQVTDETAYAVNAFSYKTAAAILPGGDTSGCYSPLSLYQALSILASGAEGETRDQILSLLGIGDLDTLAEESGKLYRVNYKDNDVNILRISNSLWLDDTDASGGKISYNLDWVQSAASNYYADIYSAEFGNEAVNHAMGSWIAEKTGGMLNPKFEFNSDTVMAILNTLWYKTNWAEEFETEKTSEDTFTTASGEVLNCDFMHKTESTGSYVQGDGYLKSYLRLETGKMIIVLPDEDQDIDSFLTEEKLWEVFENANYESAEIHWSVPKFETDVTYDLTDSLKSLGITTAFDLTAADFSPIAETESPMYLGFVQQGNHIAINEEGVEAASYTLVGMEMAAAEPDEQPVIEMDLDRPFLYLITANDGSTLFIGVVRDPNN